jgi:dTDP-4-amino-4,6-dideoxygalactose transaminase
MRRVAIADRYDQALADSPLTLPAARGQAAHVYHLYVVACDNRDGLMAHLAAHKIGSAVHYPVPVHCQNAYAEQVIVPKTGLPVTAELAGRILTLPIYPELSVFEVDSVIESIRRYYKSSR